ncbi:MAG: TRAP transporter small permease [Candidatus Competibacteraceae bacterium]|nr:TRAP transporter small permease [Candidatus Competibacteraceae bacterium]
MPLTLPIALARLVTLASRLLDIVVGTLLLVIVIVMLAQVFGRYVLDDSLVWSEELTRLLHVWMVMLAAIKAAHMRIDLLLDRLPARLRQVAQLAGAALSCALLVLMIKGGLNMIKLTAYDRYTGLPLSMKYVYVALVIGVVLWIPVVLGRIFLTVPANPQGAD